MNTNTLLSALVAILAVSMLSLGSAALVDSNGFVVSVDDITINHVHSSDLVLATSTGDTVPVKVSFLAGMNASDVKVRVEVYGGNEEYSDSTGRFDILEGKVYSKLLNLQLPKRIKDETNRDLNLKVRVYSPDSEFEETFVISLQRDSYKLDVVSVDYDVTVSAGDVVPVSVVIKNRGFHDSDEGFVTVTIPELGAYAKGYFGDLASVENCDDECNEEDATQKIVYLRIPQTAKTGVYDLVVKVTDEETSTTVVDAIKVDAHSSSQVVSAEKSQDVKAGETKTFELILVNSADQVMVYNLRAVSGSDLSVSVPSVVTVDAQSSKTVPFTVTVSSDADEGVYPFTVEANGQAMVFSANVTGKTVSFSAVALTVVLVIVFLILLVVLILLLTKKDKPAEEVETSYY